MLAKDLKSFLRPGRLYQFNSDNMVRPIDLIVVQSEDLVSYPCFVTSEQDYTVLFETLGFKPVCGVRFCNDHYSTRCFYVTDRTLQHLVNVSLKRKSKRSMRFKRLLDLAMLSGASKLEGAICLDAAKILSEQISIHLSVKRRND